MCCHFSIKEFICFKQMLTYDFQMIIYVYVGMFCILFLLNSLVELK